jgi:ribosomal protein S18 acetylase RimI-like enzyme
VIEKDANYKGAKAIRLDVFTENPYALKLYHDCGYSRVGTVEWRKGKSFLMEKYL